MLNKLVLEAGIYAVGNGINAGLQNRTYPIDYRLRTTLLGEYDV